jgi:hypothetical protein
MELKTWEDAETAGTEYAELTSQLEILKEHLREFCARRHDAVGKARVLGPIIVGFQKIAPTVEVPTEAMDWLRSFWGGRFTELKSVPRKPELKRFLEKLASQEALETCHAQGIVLVAGYEVFRLKLARNQEVES